MISSQRLFNYYHKRKTKGQSAADYFDDCSIIFSCSLIGYALGQWKVLLFFVKADFLLRSLDDCIFVALS